MGVANRIRRTSALIRPPISGIHGGTSPGSVTTVTQPVMRLRFYYRFEEFAEALRVLKRGLFVWMLISGGVTIALTGAVAAWFVVLAPQQFLGYALGVTGLLAGIVLLRLPSRLIARAWRANPQLADQRTVLLGDDGVTLRAAALEKTAGWADLRRVYETPDIFILRQSDDFLYILPRRAFGGEDGDALPRAPGPRGVGDPRHRPPPLACRRA